MRGDSDFSCENLAPPVPGRLKTFSLRTCQKTIFFITDVYCKMPFCDRFVCGLGISLYVTPTVSCTIFFFFNNAGCLFICVHLYFSKSHIRQYKFEMLQEPMIKRVVVADWKPVEQNWSIQNLRCFITTP